MRKYPFPTFVLHSLILDLAKKFLTSNRFFTIPRKACLSRERPAKTFRASLTEIFKEKNLSLNHSLSSYMSEFFISPKMSRVFRPKMSRSPVEIYQKNKRIHSRTSACRVITHLRLTSMFPGTFFKLKFAILPHRARKERRI